MTCENNPFTIWTIYDSPDDFPGQVVARQFMIERGNPDPVVGKVRRFESVAHAAKYFADLGFERLPRHVKDEPAIVESWI